MKIQKDLLQEDFSRDLYWIRIFFISDDGIKRTKILSSSSVEYWSQVFGIPIGNKITPEIAEPWINLIIEKWSKLGDEIFNQDIHYDVYATTLDGEANGLNFLLKEIN